MSTPFTNVVATFARNHDLSITAADRDPGHRNNTTEVTIAGPVVQVKAGVTNETPLDVVGDALLVPMVEKLQRGAVEAYGLEEWVARRIRQEMVRAAIRLANTGALTREAMTALDVSEAQLELALRHEDEHRIPAFGFPYRTFLPPTTPPVDVSLRHVDLDPPKPRRPRQPVAIDRPRRR